MRCVGESRSGGGLSGAACCGQNFMELSFLYDLKLCPEYQGFGSFSWGHIHVWSIGFPVWLKKGTWKLQSCQEMYLQHVICNSKTVISTEMFILWNPLFESQSWSFWILFSWMLFFRLKVRESRIPSPINTIKPTTIHAQKEKLHAPPKAKVGKLRLAGCLPISPLKFCWISQF